jgi:CheY-like chemotaxis protein
MKSSVQARKRGPLRYGLEVVDRFGRFHLHDAKQPSTPFALQYQVWIPLGLTPHGCGLLAPWVYGDVKFPLIFRLEQANDSVVLELLPDGPDEDRAHTTSDTVCISPSADIRWPRYQMGLSDIGNMYKLDVPARDPASKGAEYSIMAPVPSSPTKQESPPRVLIVDDDVSVTDTFSRMLRLEGYEVWAALSADEGLTLAQTHRPHAVILDLRMPLTSGLQFLRAIRSIPGLTNTPVAIVTGDYYLDDAQSNEIRELGAELRYKPLWLEELVTLARELLDSAVRE